MRRFFALLLCLGLAAGPSAYARGDLLGLTGAGGKITVATGGASAPVYQTSASVMSIPTNSVQAIVTKPASVAAGDLLLFEYSAYFTTSFSSFTPPAGLTLVRSRTADQNGYPATAIYYRIADGLEGANFTFSASGSGPYAGSAIAVRISGANATTPVETSNDQLTSTGATGTYPSVTTGGANRLLVVFGAGDFNAVQTGSTFPTVVPTGFTVTSFSTSATDTIYTGGATKTQAASGATGSFTVATPSTINAFQGFTLAVQP